MDEKLTKPAILFMYERIKDTVLNLSKGCTLKMCIDLGIVDKNDNKKRYYQEYMYPSKKYPNVDQLVTVSRNFTPYLEFEYPSENGETTKNRVMIRMYSMPAFRQSILEFDSKFMNAFYEKKGELKLDSSKVTKIVSHPVKDYTIEFSQDLYSFDDGKGNTILDMGVRIGFNEEYWTTIKWTSWKSIVEFFYHCDLYLYGSNLMNFISSSLIGSSLSEIGSGGYNSNGVYRETYYEPDPNDIAEAMALKNKPKKKTYSNDSFFNNL